MFEVLSNEVIAPQIHRLVVRAPRVAAARLPGQFVIVRRAEGEERIPLTIADASPSAGTISLIIQAVGAGTKAIVATPVGEALLDVAGPLGQPTEIEPFGRVACVGGGVGTAVLFPLAKALAEAGNQVTTLIGGRTAEHVILRDDLAAFSAEMLFTTEDGSLGRKGFVTAALGELLDDPARKPAAVYAVGPVPMMAAIANQTRPYGVKTIVSLNPIMVDGTGMCGGCRVTVGGEIKFACVDGPEFDGHAVDFQELSSRQKAYAEHACRLEAKVAELKAQQQVVSVSCSCSTPQHTACSSQGASPCSASSTKPTDCVGGIAPHTAKPTAARPHMPEHAPAIRATDFSEVNLGLAETTAVAEAARCLQCKKRPCVAGCPVAVRIPEFLGALAAGDFAAAADILLTDNALPATTGRVCPQEKQCEALCVRGVKGEAVAIGWLERFVADWAARHHRIAPPTVERSGCRVAVVGSGPGGLTAAGELARLGHDVTILEALHAAGGVLRYGIPEFRLPKHIVDAEVANLRTLGVKIETNVVVGKTVTVPQIMEQFDACFVANGAGLPMFLNVPGENLKGVYSANEYLTRVNLMGAYQPQSPTPIATGETAVIFGGGNTAMDAVRTARRLGSKRAILAYRRSESEMPARLEEVKHAREEGIEFLFLVAPLELVGDESGWVRSVRLQRMELGAPDASGRRRPVPVEGSEFELPADVAIVAIGTSANPLLTATCPDLKLNRWGNIEVDEATGMTSIPGVFAGGDIVRGGATVILAMGDGKKAARSIDAYLRTQPARTAAV